VPKYHIIKEMHSRDLNCFSCYCGIYDCVLLQLFSVVLYQSTIVLTLVEIPMNFCLLVLYRNYSIFLEHNITVLGK